MSFEKLPKYRELAKALEEIVGSVEYMCGAPHWEAKRRWDIQAKLGKAKCLVVKLQQELEAPVESPQYTGYVDKNGRLICYGDTLKDLGIVDYRSQTNEGIQWGVQIDYDTVWVPLKEMDMKQVEVELPKP